MKSNLKQTTGDIIRQLRENRGLPLRKIAALLDIDTSYYSKIERNEKKATKIHIQKLEAFFELDKNSLLIQYLSDKILYEISDEDCADEVLKVIKKQVNTLKHTKNKL
ncbi:helix-turn-helix transcriptional regulator [Chryseobacterium sp. LC2016-27]|uniref:helix-turn-helix domain-containing protein n=1 Tax=Chryseobacterium sp. LC2016-27 TaxID=2897326 RepID=UPI001E4561CF|nr:helix-turn-helix transcriptional regulator [Chryseobacterium sp. LC2016-27]MCD0456344.1 helix-turn-helix transcriptional regulator [Chryseobacterium sp. LC2016-27]